LTGYRGDDVHRVIDERFKKSGLVEIVDLPLLKGNLTRLAAFLGTFNEPEDFFMCGIDSLVSLGVLRRFWSNISQVRNNVSILVSTKIDVALTHALVRVNDGVVTSYNNFSRTSGEDCFPGLCVDTGIRYFPKSLFGRIKKEGSTQGRPLPLFMEKIVKEGCLVSATVFTESWNHFASVEDFL